MNAFHKFLFSIFTALILLGASVQAQSYSEQNSSEYFEEAHSFNKENYIYLNEHEKQELRAGITKVVKAAIKVALRNESALISAVRRWIGEDAAAAVASNFARARPVLERLLTYEELVWETVQDQLVGAGVPSNIAYWIRKGLEWLV